MATQVVLSLNGLVELNALTAQLKHYPDGSEHYSQRLLLCWNLSSGDDSGEMW